MFTKCTFKARLFFVVLFSISISAQQFTLEATLDYEISKSMIFDTDGDGICEYFVSTDDGFNVFDGSTHQLKYSIPESYPIWNDPQIAQNPNSKFPHIDFNSDGVSELIMNNSEDATAVIIYDMKNDQNLFEFDSPENYTEFTNLIDIDGDGELEIIISGLSYNQMPPIAKTYIYSTGVNLTNLEKPSNSLYQNFKLAQNYPNPFNPTTTIKYTVPTRNKISIKIYDINGQMIRELINEEKSSGEYSVVWDGQNNFGSKVASGTYFYQIQTGDFSQAKKMILLK